MAKIVSKLALMAVLAPEDDDSQSAAAAAGVQSLPSLDERVDLFLRAMHGTRAASAQERASARLRILDAMAADLAGESDSYLEQNIKDVSVAAPTRAAAKATVSGSDILARFADALREALLWPLTVTIYAGQPMRLAAVSCAALLVVGGAWTATWFYAARTTETAIASWIDSEAKAGRDYSCGSRSTGGFPLRVEVSCTALQATVAMSDQSTLVVNAKSLRTAANILSPGTLVTNISGPVSVTSSSQSATFVGNWSLAQMTLHGQPASPSQVSVVLDNPEFYRLVQGTNEHVLAGSRLEFNATTIGASIINIAAHAVDVSIPEGGPITSRPFVADISATLHDVDNRTPQMFYARLRDWQSRGGRLEVAAARIQQGDALATGVGEIRLSDSGRVEGALRVSAAGLYQRLAQSYIRDGRSGARERERLAQSVLGGPKINTRSLGTPQSDQPADQPADREAGPRGERQRQQLMPQEVGNLEIPIRFMDGAVFLGSTGLGKIPPLF
jgi:hypothetical protein